MGVGDVGRPSLEVDPELLERYGNQLLTAADGLPAAPPPFVVTGTDAISAAIAEKVLAVEGPFLDQLPQLRADASKTASTIVSAAGQYQRTDQQLAANYEKHQFERANGTAGGSGAASEGDAMSQTMSMPMQMASQVVSALGSLPQGIMQGVQQVSQMAGGIGSSQGREDESTSEDGQRDDRRDEEHDARAPEAPPVTSPVPQRGSPRHAAPDPELSL